jgi:hypothetical protein
MECWVLITPPNSHHGWHMGASHQGLSMMRCNPTPHRQSQSLNVKPCDSQNMDVFYFKDVLEKFAPQQWIVWLSE